MPWSPSNGRVRHAGGQAGLSMHVDLLIDRWRSKTPSGPPLGCDRCQYVRQANEDWGRRGALELGSNLRLWRWRGLVLVPALGHMIPERVDPPTEARGLSHGQHEACPMANTRPPWPKHQRRCSKRRCRWCEGPWCHSEGSGTQAGRRANPRPAGGTKSHVMSVMAKLMAATAAEGTTAPQRGHHWVEGAEQLHKSCY